MMSISVSALCCIAMLLIGSMALPPQPVQNHSRSNDKSKQTTPLYHLSENQPKISAVPSNSTKNSIDIDAIVDNKASKYVAGSASKPVGVAGQIDNDAPTTLSLSFSPSAATTTTDRNSPMEQSSTMLSMPDSRTELVPQTVNNDKRSTSNAIFSTSTTLIANASYANMDSSATPTEASSKIIGSIQNASAFLSSSKKPTVSLNDFTTTPASVSSKETRESTAKIRPQIKLTTNYSSLSETGVRLPEGASAALAKPTKYHYYPHNQHIYLLPECAVQQVCNAVYVRLNFTQPLCACPGRYRDPCSASLDSDDLHTTELVTDPRTKALTLVKTCEPVADMRECRTPRDWSLLALQNVRTGKSHYLVICRCPDANILEGPMSHDQPTYASVPGIRVYGMMCVQGNRRGRPLRHARSLSDAPEAEIGEGPGAYTRKEERNDQPSFPWYKVQQLMNTIIWD